MRPGPSRPVTLTDRERDELLTAAREHGRQVERLRQDMLRAARARQATLLQLHDGGLSVRQIAAALDVSAAVVAHAIATARTVGLTKGSSTPGD